MECLILSPHVLRLLHSYHVFPPGPLCPQANVTADVYPITSFCMSIEFLLLIYTVIPLPLYLCILFGTTYSVIYEVLATTFLCNSGLWDIVGKILLHLCIHLIGIQVFIMSQVDSQ